MSLIIRARKLANRKSLIQLLVGAQESAKIRTVHLFAPLLLRSFPGSRNIPNLNLARFISTATMRRLAASRKHSERICSLYRYCPRAQTVGCRTCVAGFCFGAPPYSIAEFISAPISRGGTIRIGARIWVIWKRSQEKLPDFPPLCPRENCRLPNLPLLCTGGNFRLSNMGRVKNYFFSRGSALPQSQNLFLAELHGGDHSDRRVNTGYLGSFLIDRYCSRTI